MKSIKKVMGLGGVSLGILMVCWANPVCSNITVTPPSIPVSQGKSFSIMVEIQGIEPIKGEFFYRPVGARQYQLLPFDITKKSAISIDLPNKAAVSPGVEYYVQITDASGRITS